MLRSLTVGTKSCLETWYCSHTALCTEREALRVPVALPGGDQKEDCGRTTTAHSTVISAATIPVPPPPFSVTIPLISPLTHSSSLGGSEGSTMQTLIALNRAEHLLVLESAIISAGLQEAPGIHTQSSSPFLYTSGLNSTYNQSQRCLIKWGVKTPLSS